MSHLVESMAYSQNEKPWHGLGYEVSNDLTPIEMMEAARVNWTVRKQPAVTLIDGEYKDTGKSALIRESDNKILDVISNDWNPTQNETAFEFFREFTEAGHMQMETAGSLEGGRQVWALAKIQASFEAVRDDVVQGYLLFSNPHKYGRAITVRFTPIRVVCNNTLTFALSNSAASVGLDKSVSVNHRKVFNPEEVKNTLRLAEWRMGAYAEQTAILTSARFNEASVKEYLKQVFPSLSSEKEISKPAKVVLDNLETQPGAEFGRGSWWQVFNGVTFAIDHKLGRSVDSRLNSSWFGINQGRKITALKKAVEFAEAA